MTDKLKHCPFCGSEAEIKIRLIELFKKIEYTPFPEMTMKSNLGNQFTDYALNCIVDELLANGVIVPIRCKDCKYYTPIKQQSTKWKSKTFYCTRNVNMKMNENDYCSCAKLKELG